MDVRAMERAARRQGWRVERCKRSGHALWYPPDKARGPVTVEGTAGDWRALRNTAARLRRAGLVLDDAA